MVFITASPTFLHLEACGIGRLVNLGREIELKTILQRWCQYSKMKHLRVAYPLNKHITSKIKTIAICVGSGT